MICYEGRTWPKPTDKLMKLLMCKEGKDNHSYIYMRNAKGEWEFKKNGFYYAENRMSDDEFDGYGSDSQS